MRPIIQEITTAQTPESLVERLAGEPGVVLLRSALFDSSPARYSFVTAQPFLTLRAFGSRCELAGNDGAHVQFGNPWQVLDGLMARYELLDEVDLPFPLGGCFGYWGYELKNFVEPRLPRRAVNDLVLPDCHAGFYDSLVAFDHHLGKTWVISTGLNADGSRNEARGRRQVEFWSDRLGNARHHLPLSGKPAPHLSLPSPLPEGAERDSSLRIRSSNLRNTSPSPPLAGERAGERWRSNSLLIQVPGKDRLMHDRVSSTMSRAEFIAAVERAQRYIRAGDIYQVNLAHRLAASCPMGGWQFYEKLTSVSPAPFSAFLDCGDFQIASSSPELFLRLSGTHILTRPIKGTRPRSADPNRDAQLTYELQTSPKEMAELVMITDLLRNDLGRVCEYGSVRVPELVRLERYPQVQHLVSTVEGRLRPAVPHFAAFASCFPGGSITGAPKIRAMEIIDELEPVTRGPYTGALGYLGFNRESQLAIAIRTAICKGGTASFHAGAGIVADSVPEAEYDETIAKARGFLAALEVQPQSDFSPQTVH